MDGGVGVDTLSYTSATAAVTVNLTASTSSGGAGNDIFTGFENIIGSSAADSILGDTGNNIIDGGLGADTMDGGDGVDTLSYTSATSAITVNLLLNTVSGGGGNDSIINFENVIGSSAADSIIANSAANSISAGSGDDTIDAGLGNDTIDAGAGVDTLSYASSPAAVTVNLPASVASGGAGNDIFTGFENIIGSSAADSILGDTANNTLELGCETQQRR